VLDLGDRRSAIWNYVATTCPINHSTTVEGFGGLNMGRWHSRRRVKVGHGMYIAVGELNKRNHTLGWHQ